VARPHKQTVDYFPHDTDASDGKTLTIIQAKYGNDGYAFWFKLLQLLGRAPGHFYDFNKPADWEYLLAKTHQNDAEKATSILETLAALSAIDAELFAQGTIWCQKFVDGVADVYNRTVNGAPQRPAVRESLRQLAERLGCSESYLSQIVTGKRPASEKILQKCLSLGIDIQGVNVELRDVSVPVNEVSTNRNSKNATETPQTKLNKTKLNDIYIAILTVWNDQKIIVHQKVTAEMKRAIDTTLKEHSQEEISLAIKNYAEILKGSEYYWTHSWTLREFLKRGLEKFLDLEVARQNYREKGGKGGAHLGHPSERRLPTRYRGPEETFGEQHG